MKNQFMRLVCLLGSAIAATMVGNAQNLMANAHVPFEFAAGGKLLPAGDYTIEAPDWSGVLLIRDGAGNSAAVLAVTGAPAVVNQTSKLTFERRGATLVLSSVELPDQTVRLVPPGIAKPAAGSASLASPMHR